MDEPSIEFSADDSWRVLIQHLTPILATKDSICHTGFVVKCQLNGALSMLFDFHRSDLQAEWIIKWKQFHAFTTKFPINYLQKLIESLFFHSNL